MNNRKFKDELESYLDTLAEIDSKELSIKQIEKKMATVSGSNFEINGDIRAKGYVNNTAEEYIINKRDRIQNIRIEIEELKSKIKAIDSIISTLNPYNKRLVELRYKYSLSLEAIAMDTQRSESSICRTINNCIEKMSKKWEKWTIVK